MVVPDVRNEPQPPLLVERLHIDLCRLAGALCRHPAGRAR
ncbi:putative leader peptide [Streptomyces calidiresistens]|nr:putative leader peptide [Streptomyces calidiresistens]